MKSIRYRPLVLGLTALVFSFVVWERTQAGSHHFYAPVTDPLVKEECGGCHLAFPASMLPARSWQQMMGELKNHFGDDASLDAETTAKITAYLVANAADNGGRRYSRSLLKGTSMFGSPQRITELPKWVHKHRKVPDWEWRHQEVRTKANCTACHVNAEQGYYDE